MSAPASTYTCPGKIFVLGEYAVLAGEPALVAAVGPRFEMRVEDGDPSSFHPESPAGKLFEWADRAGASRLALGFSDPFRGAGGFGASTAQYALAYRALADRHGWPGDWRSAWKLYRELCRRENELSTPSGADLVAQWQGGIVHLHANAAEAEDLWDRFDWSALLIFSATGQPGRKVATHEHLGAMGAADVAAVSARWASALGGPLREGIEAARAGDPRALGRAMDLYAEALRSCKLEVPATFADLRALRSLPCVLGAKGAGAMQADAVLLLVDPAAPRDAREEIVRVAERRGLRLVCDGIARQKGVQCGS